MISDSLKKQVLIVAAAGMASFVLTCKSVDRIVGGEILEGWGIEDDQDVFYMKIEGRASERAEEKDTFSMKKSTCVESTGLQAKDKVIKKMLGEYISSSAVTFEGETQTFVVQSLSSGLIRGVQMKECRSTENHWLNCECVYFVKGPDLKKKFLLQVEKAQENIYDR